MEGLTPLTSRLADIGINVLSDVVFLGLVVLLGRIIYAATGRRRLLNFFGISGEKAIKIYLSNIRIISGGSIGIDRQHRQFSGSTVVFSELSSAQQYNNLFNPLIPWASDSPGILGRVLMSDIRTSIEISPVDEFEVERDIPIIAFGSPGYNFASKYIEVKADSLVRFDSDNSVIAMDEARFSDASCGFVLRNYDRDVDRTCFYTAGLSELGTEGAANYLRLEWRTLRRKYGDRQNFAVILRFTTSTSWSIIAERSQDP